MHEDYKLCPYCHNTLDKKDKQCPYCLNFVDTNNYTNNNPTDENNVNDNEVFKIKYTNKKADPLYKFFELLPWIIITGEPLPLEQKYWDAKNSQWIPNKFDEKLVKKAKIVGAILYISIILIPIIIVALSELPQFPNFFWE